MAGKQPKRKPRPEIDEYGRTDMYISTLRDLIRAMGGELEVVARFPDRAPVRITQFRTLKGEVIPRG